MASIRSFVGALIALTFSTRDRTTGAPADPTSVVLTITLPDGTTATPTVTNTAVGEYAVDYTPATAGAYQFSWVGTGNNADGGAADSAYVAGASIPDLADCKAYMGETSLSDGVIQQALDAETAAQSSACQMAPYSADLAEALLRRVQRNLAMRRLAGAPVDAEGPVILPSRDPEVRRLEAPYRRVVVG